MGTTQRKASRRDVDLGARFTPAEKARVDLAMNRAGRNLSDFVRDAVLTRAETILAQDALAAFQPAIGVLDVPGDFGRRADEVLADLLIEKHARRDSKPTR